jgi:hypothetical protein
VKNYDLADKMRQKVNEATPKSPSDAFIAEMNRLITDYNYYIVRFKDSADSPERCNYIRRDLYSKRITILDLIDKNIYLFPSGSKEYNRLMEQKQFMIYQNNNREEVCKLR